MKLISSIDVPVKEKEEVAKIIHSMMAHFVDSAFGVQTDQITLQYALKSHFQAAFDHANFGEIPKNQTTDAKIIGLKTDSSIRGPSEP